MNEEEQKHLGNLESRENIEPEQTNSDDSPRPKKRVIVLQTNQLIQRLLLFGLFVLGVIWAYIYVQSVALIFLGIITIMSWYHVFSIFKRRQNNPPKTMYEEMLSKLNETNLKLEPESEIKRFIYFGFKFTLVLLIILQSFAVLSLLICLSNNTYKIVPIYYIGLVSLLVESEYLFHVITDVFNFERYLQSPDSQLSNLRFTTNIISSLLLTAYIAGIVLIKLGVITFGV